MALKAFCLNSCINQDTYNGCCIFPPNLGDGCQYSARN